MTSTRPELDEALSGEAPEEERRPARAQRVEAQRAAGEIGGRLIGGDEHGERGKQIEREQPVDGELRGGPVGEAGESERGQQGLAQSRRVRVVERSRDRQYQVGEHAAP